MSSVARSILTAASACAAALLLSQTAYGFDADAAMAMAKRSGCFKCHAIDKDKDGPAYQKVAQKYKDNPEAEQKLFDHLTIEKVVKMPDGTEDTHKTLRTKDLDAIKNLVQWLLAQ